MLADLLRTCIVASLGTDENRPLRCTLALLDADEGRALPEAHPERWTITRLQPPSALTSRSLLKLAQAVPPSSGALAIKSDAASRLWLWGVIDQEGRATAYRRLEPTVAFERPGLIQVEVTGPYRIDVYLNYAKVLSLRPESTKVTFPNALAGGPLHHRLLNFAAPARSKVVHGNASADIGVEALVRILWRMQERQHGGALLLLPDRNTTDLHFGHRCAYRGLAKAVDAVAHHDGRHRLLLEWMVQVEERGAPCEARYGARLAQNVEAEHLMAAAAALTAAIDFTAGLTGADGVVVLHRGLLVAGFGVEIRTANDPKAVRRAAKYRNEWLLPETLDADQFGTRHRSLIRYCGGHEDAVGLVVSQDGDTRAIVGTARGVEVFQDLLPGKEVRIGEASAHACTGCGKIN